MNDRWHLRHARHGDRPWAVQQEALLCAAGRPRYGYWLEQGLGKTSLTLNEYVGRDDVELLIVIAPQSFKQEWALAPAEWGVEFLRAGYWPRDPLPVDWPEGVYAVNYEAATRNNSKIREPLRKMFEQRPVMLAVDESSALKNPSSGFTKGVLELCKRAKVVRLLNGTPITQSPMDYFAQLRALGELNGWNSVSFRNRFAVLGGFQGRQILSDIRNGEELAKILDGCSFRALKSDWRKDLPPKSYSTVHVELTDKQRVHYGTMLEEFYSIVDDEDITADMVVTQLLKLQQVSSGFFLNAGKVIPVVRPEDNSKLRAVLDIAGNEYGKTIVVYHYKESGRMLREAFPGSAYIQGGMTGAEVTEQKAKFNDDPECRVLVAQERAAALGHTLLGQPGKDRCTRMAFYENSYSLYYRLQIEDRIHRGEQDLPCSYYDVVCSPVEEATIQILTGKRDMAQSMDDVIKAVRNAALDRRR